MQEKSHQPETIESWDPLDTSSTDPRMIVAAQRRVIRNILKSYTGYYDVFCELLQNALDAVERRYAEKGSNYKPQIWIRVDIQQSQISVTDNGCGMTVAQFKTFLAPNLSFKDGKRFRGSKGVGATYLAYGFNHLEVATKLNDKLYSGILRGGRNWVEDSTETMVRPMVENVGVMHTIFQSLDRGTSFTIRLNGSNIRPKDLSWFGATTAEQWLAVLRLVSPLGGIYMCNEAVPNIQINVETIQLPPKYLKLNGLWGEWTGEEIINKGSPITSSLDDIEQELVLELKVKLSYISLWHSRLIYGIN